MEPILQAERVSFRYPGALPALEEVTLAVRAGATCAVIGANGSGKSTLLKVLDGLLPPAAGRVLFKGREVSERSLKDPAFLREFRSCVGFVFQDSDVQLFCPTVFDELLFGPLQTGVPPREAEARAVEVLRMLGIEELRDRPPFLLSGGEKKRVAIGSVLTMNPEVLLFDEPTIGLDPRTQAFLLELLLALHEGGKTVVLATHDLSLVGELSAEVAVLSEEHRIVRTGPAADILADTDLLLRVNLIHEHRHRHGAQEHTHLHSHHRFHDH